MHVVLDRLGILHITKTVATFMQSSTKSAMAAIGALSAGFPSGRVGLLQARCAEVPGCVRRQRLGIHECGGTAVPAAGSSGGKAQARLRHLEIQHMWTQERLQKGKFLLKSVHTDENVADLMMKDLAAARVEELLSKFGVRRCARGLVIASLITRVEANHLDGRTDHVATVSLAHEIMLLVDGCVVLVLALVVLAAAGAYCRWRRCCCDTVTRECEGSVPKRGIATESVCSARRRMLECPTPQHGAS